MFDHDTSEAPDTARMSRRGALRLAGLTAAGVAAVAWDAGSANAAPVGVASRVNSIGMSPNQTSTAVTVIWANARTAFLYYRDKFHHDEKLTLPKAKRISAGIVGNLCWESGVDPKKNQSGGGAGRGIAQWGVGGRWDTTAGDNVVWYAAKTSRSRYRLDHQLEFILWELHHKGYGYTDLMKAGTVHTAETIFEKQFEKPGNPHHAERIELALQVYEKYKNL